MVLRLSLYARFVLALVLPALLTLGAAVFAYWALERNARDARAMFSVRSAQTQHQRLLTAVLEAETGKRGYLTTGDPAFLESYRRAPDTFDDAFLALEASEAGHEAHGDADGMERVRALFERWREQVAEPVIEARRRHPVALASSATDALVYFVRAREARRTDGAGTEALARLGDTLEQGRQQAGDSPAREAWRAAAERLAAWEDAAPDSAAPSLQAALVDLLAATREAEEAVWQPIRDGDGKEILDRIHTLLAQGIAEERAELNEQVAQTERTSHLAKAVLLGGVGGAIVLGLMLSLLLLAALGRRLRLVSGAAVRVAAGDFDEHLPVDGDDELARLSDAFNRMAGDLARRERDSELLDRLGRTLQACRDEAEARDAATRFAARLFPKRSGALYIISSSRNLAELAANWGLPEGAVQREVIEPSDCWALREVRVHHYRRDGAEMPCGHLREPAPAASICFPITSQDETMGALHLATCNGDGDLSPYERLLGAAMAEQFSLALGNLRLREFLRAQSIRDPLTGLFNRRYLEETLERELQRARRAEDHLAALALDLDHFKRLNDEFGHDAGDVVLKRTGAVLSAAVRGSDIATRSGGEEFVLLLSGADANLAAMRAEEVRAAIETMELAYRNEALGQVTVSVGVATFPEHARTAAGLLRAADEALYRAKNTGRNRVAMAPAQPDANSAG